MVHQLDLGPQSSDGNPAESEFLAARDAVPGDAPQFLDRPFGDGGQRRTIRDQPAIEECLARTAGSTFRIQAYTVGYTRDIATLHDVEAGIGANVSTYRIPAAIQPYYGERPWGVNFYLRFRLNPPK